MDRYIVGSTLGFSYLTFVSTFFFKKIRLSRENYMDPHQLWKIPSGSRYTRDMETASFSIAPRQMLMAGLPLTDCLDDLYQDILFNVTYGNLGTP